MTPNNIGETKEALKFAKRRKLPVFLLGNGSNILFSDSGFKGVVIKYSEDCIYIKKNKVIVSAGTNLSKLINLLADCGLSGLEFLAGIPGLIGGAIAMNAGIGKSEISKNLVKVKVLDLSGREKTLKKKDLKFGYRESVLQKGKQLLIEAEFRFKKSAPYKIRRTVKRSILKRQKTQPLQFPSAGSVFKNPKGKYAGRLIEAAQCKGMRVGDARVSNKHANFIINCGKASSANVKKLMELVCKKVYKKHKIRLFPEIKLVAEK